MGSFGERQLLEQALAFSVNEDEVRQQDAPSIISAVAANAPIGRDLAWKFFIDNYEELRRRYKTGMLMNRIIKSVTEKFVTEAKVSEIQKFFSEVSSKPERTVSQGIEAIKLNVDWISRDEDKIRKFLSSQ